jgi:hypothetical protein
MRLTAPNTPPDVTLTQSFSVSLQTLSENLSDPNKIPLRHPLIHRVEITRSEQESNLSRVSFQVWEKVPLLMLSIPNHYSGMITRDPSHPNELMMEAWSRPAVHLQMHLFIEESGGRCTLTERAWIKAPWLVRSFVIRTFTAAHRSQFERLSALLAG